ncbi:MAG: hypothetical protein WC661_10215 [Opitutaceae bacterium]|jgi:hypothetical protein
MKTFFLLFFIALILVGMLSGCQSGRARAGSTSVKQTGPAQTPARAEAKDAAATFTAPAGSKVEFNEKLGTYTVTLSGPAVIAMTAHTETATAPQAFTPPPPPTPSDQANGRAMWFYRIALFGGLAAGLFGLVRGWDFVMYGGGAIAAAALIGLFIASNPVLFAIIGGGVALAGAGVAIWHFKLKHLPAAA